jgi:peptidyl-prolyl cis-trans isomerase D
MPAPTPEANEAIFAAQRPAAGKVTAGKAKLPDGSYAVFAVEKVTEGDLKELPAEQRTMMQQQLAQLGGNSAVQAYIDAMRKRFKVDVMEDRL